MSLPIVQEAHQIGGPPIGPPIAANPQDKWVVITDSFNPKLLVITQNGECFYHHPQRLDEPAIRLNGPPVAANPQDKWVLSFANLPSDPLSQWPGTSRIVVITEGGAVFGHEWGEDLEDESMSRQVGETFQFQAPPVAANPQDKWVLRDRDPMALGRIVVITQDGRVFAHRVTGSANVVGDPFQLQGPPVAANPQDKWVLIHQDHIVVVTDDGSVFAHHISPLLDQTYPPDEAPGRNHIGDAIQVQAPRVAANPIDRHLLSGGVGELLVITEDGRLFAHLTRGFWGPYPPSGARL